MYRTQSLQVIVHDLRASRGRNYAATSPTVWIVLHLTGVNGPRDFQTPPPPPTVTGILVMTSASVDYMRGRSGANVKERHYRHLTTPHEASRTVNPVISDTAALRNDSMYRTQSLEVIVNDFRGSRGRNYAATSPTVWIVLHLTVVNGPRDFQTPLLSPFGHRDPSDDFCQCRLHARPSGGECKSTTLPTSNDSARGVAYSQPRDIGYSRVMQRQHVPYTITTGDSP